MSAIAAKPGSLPISAISAGIRTPASVKALVGHSRAAKDNPLIVAVKK
ncbi:hypothetical protein AB4Z51_36965 [Bradyrhizobium sp. 2TAF36]